MDALRGFLEDIKGHGLQRGHTLGLFHLLIGCHILKSDGTILSSGLSWRELALLLKKNRWSKEAVHDLEVNPKTLPPRDRQQYWYTAICLARVDSEDARRAGAVLAGLLEPLGYRVT